MRPSRILVTGAAGHIGQHLLRELSGRGHDVFASDLLNHLHMHRCDVGEYRQVERLFRWSCPETVYHLAAEFGRHNGEMYYENLWRTNVVGTRNVLSVAGQYASQVVIFSSSEVYGDWAGTMVETVPETHAIHHLNEYAITKWVNELQALNSDTSTVRVRLFNTYGPGEVYHPYRGAVPRFIHHALKGIPYTVYLGHSRTHSYVEDTVRTLANITDNFIPGEVYNIAGTERVTMKELSDLILASVGIDDVSLGVLYKDAEPRTTLHKEVDVTKAQRDLQHASTVPLAQGIERTVRWMKDLVR